MGLRLTFLMLAILLYVPLAHATKFYKWVDKEGNISYHDKPPFTEGYRVEEKNIGLRASPTSGVPADVVEKFPVVLYVASKCSSCESARAYLKNRGVPYTEKNVEGDRKIQNELIKQSGGLAVPTITIGSKVMKGYLESLLEGELDQAGYPKAGAGESSESENSEGKEKPES